MNESLSVLCVHISNGDYAVSIIILRGNLDLGGILWQE